MANSVARTGYRRRIAFQRVIAVAQRAFGGTREFLGKVFGFDPSAPDVVLGPSILPTTGLQDTDPYGVTPASLRAIPLPLSFPVPEPGTQALLATAPGGLTICRTRRR